MRNYDENLAKCPFCGGDAFMGQLWMSPYDIVPKGYRVTCKKCGAETGLKNTPEKASEAWNMRKEKNNER